MGLLDDAIREHLELKRLRGADPGEVAREQREALDPVPRRGEEQPHEDDPASGDHGVQAARDPDFSNVGQETAELDMRTVLDESHGAAGSHAAPAPEGAVAGSVRDGSGEATEGAAHPADESLEWEVPASSDEHVHAGVSDPGDESERGTSGAGGTSSAGGVAGPGRTVGEPSAEEAEDVLEETPDFLRDTPEQERLWFEQRPPRDFDFDK